MEAIAEEEARIFHAPGRDMVADIGTKTLPAPILEKLMRLLCMASLLQVTTGMEFPEDHLAAAEEFDPWFGWNAIISVLLALITLWLSVEPIRHFWAALQAMWMDVLYLHQLWWDLGLGSSWMCFLAPFASWAFWGFIDWMVDGRPNWLQEWLPRREEQMRPGGNGVPQIGLMTYVDDVVITYPAGGQPALTPHRNEAPPYWRRVRDTVGQMWEWHAGSGASSPGPRYGRNLPTGVVACGRCQRNFNIGFHGPGYCETLMCNRCGYPEWAPSDHGVGRCQLQGFVDTPCELCDDNRHVTEDCELFRVEPQHPMTERVSRILFPPEPPSPPWARIVQWWLRAKQWCQPRWEWVVGGGPLYQPFTDASVHASFYTCKRCHMDSRFHSHGPDVCHPKLCERCGGLRDSGCAHGPGYCLLVPADHRRCELCNEAGHWTESCVVFVTDVLGTQWKLSNPGDPDPFPFPTCVHCRRPYEVWRHHGHGICSPTLCGRCTGPYTDTDHGPGLCVDCRPLGHQCHHCGRYGHLPHVCPEFSTPHRRLQAPLPASGSRPPRTIVDAMESDLSAESSWVRSIREGIERETPDSGRVAAWAVSGLPASTRMDLRRPARQVQGGVQDQREAVPPRAVHDMEPPLPLGTNGLPYGIPVSTRVWVAIPDTTFHLYRACRALRHASTIYSVPFTDVNVPRANWTPRPLCGYCAEEFRVALWSLPLL